MKPFHFVMFMVKKFESHTVKFYNCIEEPYFDTQDIARIVGMEEIDSNMDVLDDDEKKVITLTDELGNNVDKVILSESGIHAVLLLSKAPNRKIFIKWLFEFIHDMRLFHMLHIENSKLRIEEDLIPQKNSGMLDTEKPTDWKQQLCKLGIVNVGKDDSFLVKTKDVCNVLGLVNVSSVTQNYSEDEAQYACLRDSLGRNHNTSVLTLKGLKRIVSQSRKPMSIELCKILGVNYDIKVVSKETNFVKQIQKVFKTEYIKEQFQCDRYCIDLYLPKYKLAIEFDEQHHCSKVAEDNDRQCYIEKELGCVFLRVKETDDIFDVIHTIYKHIRDYEIQ